MTEVEIVYNNRNGRKFKAEKVIVYIHDDGMSFEFVENKMHSLHSPILKF